MHRAQCNVDGYVHVAATASSVVAPAKMNAAVVEEDTLVEYARAGAVATPAAGTAPMAEKGCPGRG